MLINMQMRRPWATLSIVVVAGCAEVRGGTRREAEHTKLSCIPFARALTGVELWGDAPDWWEQAADRYRRSDKPAQGAIMVFAVEPRLPRGHVAVVSRVRDSTSIEVFHANWVPGEVARDQLVVDASPRRNWSSVRVWYPPVDALGVHTYPVAGFILPDKLFDYTHLDERAGYAAAAQ